MSEARESAGEGDGAESSAAQTTTTGTARLLPQSISRRDECPQRSGPRSGDPRAFPTQSGPSVALIAVSSQSVTSKQPRPVPNDTRNPGSGTAFRRAARRKLFTFLCDRCGSYLTASLALMVAFRGCGGKRDLQHRLNQRHHSRRPLDLFVSRFIDQLPIDKLVKHA